MLEVLKELPSDSVLGLIKLFAADQNPNKIDLGVGVYKDEQGKTPVMAAVKLAEARILEAENSKTYYGSDGNSEFLSAVTPLVFGDSTAFSDRIVGCQTVGGTGALQLAAKLAITCNKQASIWVGTPTWPNHLPLFSAAGLEIKAYEYYNTESQQINFEGMIRALASGQAGDVVLLHACCHNPTGADLNLDQWAEVADLIAAKGMLPLIDSAYLGLGHSLEQDVLALQLVMSRVPETMIAFSCSKNFGLYRERIGALFVVGKNGQSSSAIKSHVQYLARTVYSTPPNHGAAIVSTILTDPSLKKLWLSELVHSTQRINDMRQQLAQHGHVGDIDLAALGQQKGMFALLPLSIAHVNTLKDGFSVYMAPSGRINLAGLNKDNIPYFANVLAKVLAM
ncbi:amino acid aminotransferase [Pseudomonas syringae]|uniref:amino acid aminotransferase n=1 Tax=Pseudomonas syringae TaxID=317 RepID=UPI001F3ED419|nr:amino acid aminotransferase [Pseudomonas syringae]MCF5724662.1 aminotransferase class I/II-fold pyridoxal phosphate-dependent enzyme [Pseudomonas syringae]